MNFSKILLIILSDIKIGKEKNKGSSYRKVQIRVNKSECIN